jgi:protein-S-isoprenylcysteine O-methyltransferase Ste14
MISTPLLLASRLAVIPAVCATAVFVVRVVLEDRMLRRELLGYAEYATRTRFRLIPGVW